jgi:acyl-coenzyme A synthetase/AMP-(fatty) acid ligase
VINVLGNKIAVGPIEDALRETLGVTEVIVFSMQNDDAEEEAHVAVEAPAPIDTSRLAAVLADHIHGFATARVHFVAAMPRNAMGKVQRLALRDQLLRASA